MMIDLHTEINGLVEARLRLALETGEAINWPDWVAQCAESLADIIAFGALEKEQPNLIKHAHERIEFYVREKQRMFESKENSSPKQ